MVSKLVAALAFLGFASIASAQYPIPTACSVTTTDLYYYEFTPSPTVAAYVYQDTANSDTWSFIVRFCMNINNVINDIAQNDPSSWEGWNMGTLNSFTLASSGPANFFQLYENGDSGYPCTTGRRTEVKLYCNGCPTGTTCYNGTTSFCVCNGSYTGIPSSGDPCTASLDIAVNCPAPVKIHPPTPINPPKPKNPLSGGEVFGIVCLVFAIILSVGCFVGYFYNVRIHSKSGVRAIPGYTLFNKEKEGMSKFSGHSYQRTTTDSHMYGTL